MGWPTDFRPGGKQKTDDRRVASQSNFRWLFANGTEHYQPDYAVPLTKRIAPKLMVAADD